MMNRAIMLAGSATTAISLVALASAHVGTDPRTVQAGSGATVGFRVGHGCDGSPTNLVRLQIPEGVVGVRPQQKPGWEISIVKGPITPYESHGTTISEGVKEITWSGGSLPDAEFDTFTIRATFPDTPGETLYFPVVQECDEGEHAWIEIPAEGQSGDDLDSPAPAIEVVAPEGDADGHGSGGDDTGAEEAAATDDNDSSSTVAWLALGVGVLGLVAGAGGLATGMRKR